MSDHPTVDTITSDQLDNLHAQVAGWRRKAVDRALRISKLTGTIQAVNDLAHEQTTDSTTWGAGYLTAITDLREVLREFGALTEPDPTPDRDTGPATVRCCGKPAGAVCVHDIPRTTLPEPTSDQARDELAAALGGDRAATVIAHTLHMYGRTLAEVQVMDDGELRAIPGIGDTSLATIRTRLGHWATPEAGLHTESLRRGERIRQLETAIRKVLDICGDHGSDVQDILRPALSAEQAKDRWAYQLIDVLADLDRCEHGRHEGDECGSCGGPSLGNPRVGPDRVIGYSRYATPIVLPDRDHKHEPAAWRQTTTAKDHT